MTSFIDDKNNQSQHLDFDHWQTTLPTEQSADLFQMTQLEKEIRNELVQHDNEMLRKDDEHN